MYRLWTVPVSYTHLDVYKRQLQWRSQSEANLRGGANHKKAVPVRTVAVSYTHLDVYKRQLFTAR